MQVEKDIEDEFIRFGTLRSVWVARKPPGFAFVEYDDNRDAEDAIAKMDGDIFASSSVCHCP